MLILSKETIGKYNFFCIACINGLLLMTNIVDTDYWIWSWPLWPHRKELCIYLI